MELYRPLCAEEYHEIEALEYKGFPPRTEEQQLFTVLLSADGACEIARRMRLEKRSDTTVYVVSFLVDDAYIRQFPVQQSGNKRALWIPSEDMDILNQHMVGKIHVLTSYEVDRSDSDLFFA